VLRPLSYWPGLMGTGSGAGCGGVIIADGHRAGRKAESVDLQRVAGNHCDGPASGLMTGAVDPIRLYSVAATWLGLPLQACEQPPDHAHGDPSTAISYRNTCQIRPGMVALTSPFRPCELCPSLLQMGHNRRGSPAVCTRLFAVKAFLD